MKIVDYKCNDCNEINEYFLMSDDEKIECVKCKSSNLARVFSAVSLGQGSSSKSAGNSKSCSGGSCSGCSGC